MASAEESGKIDSEYEDSEAASSLQTSTNIDTTKDTSDSEESSTDGVSQEASASKHKLTKSEKKKMRFERLIEHKKRKRKEEKAKKKKKCNEETQIIEQRSKDEDQVTKKDQLKIIKEKMSWGLEHGQRICIDLSLEAEMSKKECSRLAQQIGRLYGSNRKAEMPAHLILTGVDKEGFLYKECVRKNSGFENYSLDVHQESPGEVFGVENVIYLSPDSPNILESMDHEQVYIIGGLVDETVTKNLTMSKAEELKVKTARLPIDQYMEIDHRSKGNHNKILAVNQVFDILLMYTQTHDWRMALPIGVPRRKGYMLRADI